MLCTAITRQGARCKRETGAGYCFQHARRKPAPEPAKKPEKQTPENVLRMRAYLLATVEGRVRLFRLDEVREPRIRELVRTRLERDEVDVPTIVEEELEGMGNGVTSYAFLAPDIIELGLARKLTSKERRALACEADPDREPPWMERDHVLVNEEDGSSQFSDYAELVVYILDERGQQYRCGAPQTLVERIQARIDEDMYGRTQQ
jgi:hypothetical protein